MNHNQSTALAVIPPAQVAALDEAAANCREVMAASDARTFAGALALATATAELRRLLTPEVMRPIMALQSSKLGFLTDRDRPKDGREPGYPVEVVRDVMIEGISRGAYPIGNEINIISGGCYLTRAHMFRRLHETLGRGNWQLIHAIPAIARDAKGQAIGAKCVVKVRWRLAAGAGWQEQELEFAIKGDQYASADSYRGKADRKAAAWLLEQVTGCGIPEGEVDDAIDTTARPVADDTAARRQAIREQTVTRAPAPAPAPDAGPFALAYQQLETHYGCEVLTAYCRARGYLAAEAPLAALTTSHIERLCALPEVTVEDIAAWQEGR